MNKNKYLEKFEKDMYDAKAEEFTKKYLKKNPDLRFVAEKGITEDGQPCVSFKIVKNVETSKEGD